MKKLSFLATNIFLVLSAANLNAGPSSSGGGAAVVCRNEAKQIEYAELLDLYEAHTIYGLTLVASKGSTEEDYFLSADRTYTLQGHPDLAEQERSNILEGLRRFYDLAEMTGELPRLNDLGRAPQVPNGCQIEQLAIFEDQNLKVRINLEIWMALDTLNRAALASHEAYYYFERTLEEQTSESTRAMVAHIYSTSFNSPVNEGIPPNASQGSTLDPKSKRVVRSGKDWSSSTYTRNSSFKVFPWMTPSGMGIRLQFQSIAGRPIIKKSTIEIPNVAFATTKVWSRELEMMVCMVSEPNQNVRRELELRGSLRPNATIEIHYVTNSPLRLVMKENGKVISEEYMTSCSN